MSKYIIDNQRRVLEKLAYRLHTKNRNRPSEENWERAKLLLQRLIRRYKHDK